MPTDDRRDVWERWVAENLRGGELQSAPRSAVRRAIRLGRRLRRRERVAADESIALLYDSALEALAPGLRGTPHGERRRVYGLPGPPGDPDAQFDRLDVVVRRSAGELELTGQVLPPERWKELRVRLHRTPRPCKLGSMGEFVVRGISPELESLSLQLVREDDRVLNLDDLSLSTEDTEDP
ncbi:MAG: hypothetical protein GY716_22060 [bacterium]|nr:hypothetical protein [bacterium]